MTIHHMPGGIVYRCSTPADMAALLLWEARRWPDPAPKVAK